MINIYGKGATVDTSEYWDDRTTYNTLTQFLGYQDNTLAIKNIFNDNIEMFSLLESINVDKFFAGGILKSSFGNELDITQDDYVRIEINNVIRHYIRCSPGITSFEGTAYVVKPSTELAVQELNKILEIVESDDEFVDIKFNYDTDTFKGKIHKVVDGHIEILEFTNGSDYDDDTSLGYHTGIEMLHEMYSNEFLTVMFEEAIGDELTKIDLELTKEVIDINTQHYWCLNENGLIDLYTTLPAVDVAFQINNFTTGATLDSLITFNNPHVYSLETEVFSGDLVVGGNLIVNGATTTISSVTVEIEDNMLLLNDTAQVEPTPDGVTAGISGIEVDRGTFVNYQFIFDETTDTFLIGEVGDLQPVATREPTPIDKAVAVWDGNIGALKFITSSGLVFDGTNLEIVKSTDTWGGIRISETGVSGESFAINHYGGPDSGTKISQEGAFPIRFYTNGTEAARVSGDRKLGVGSINPDKKLEVHSDNTNTTFVDGVFNFKATSNYGSLKNILSHRQDDNSVVVNDDGADLDFRVEAVGQVNAFIVIGSSGYIGIGINTPDEKLDVRGDIKFGATGNAKMSFNSLTNSIDFEVL